uniref:ABC transmembrane type-1 domain-containing protein n=1 Tax=Anopheles stephensi TaxID=30069 RepID=A0A182YG78_ANOST
MFRYGQRKEITEEKLYATLPEHSSHGLAETFERLWSEEEQLGPDKASFARVYWRAFGKETLFWGLMFSAFETANRVAQPLLLGELVSYFTPNQDTISERDAYLGSSTGSQRDDLLMDLLQQEKQEEEKESQGGTGSVGLSVYKTYIKAVNSCGWVFCLSVLMVLSQIVVSGVDIFVAEWVNWEEKVAGIPPEFDLNDNHTILSSRDVRILLKEQTDVIPSPILALTMNPAQYDQDTKIHDLRRETNPVSKAGPLSWYTFWWLKDLFRTGLKRPIDETDIYETLSSHQSAQLSYQFERHWKAEQKGNDRPSFLRVICRIYWRSILGYGSIYTIVDLLARILQPQCLGGLVSYFAPGQQDIGKEEAYYYAIGIILCSLVPVAVFHHFILYIFQIGMKIRVACCSLLYKKDMEHVVLMNMGNVEQQGPFRTLAESGHFTSLNAEQPHHAPDGRDRVQQNNAPAPSDGASNALSSTVGQNPDKSSDGQQQRKVDSVANNGIEYDTAISSIDSNSKTESHRMTERRFSIHPTPAQHQPAHQQHQSIYQPSPFSSSSMVFDGYDDRDERGRGTKKRSNPSSQEDGPSKDDSNHLHKESQLTGRIGWRVYKSFFVAVQSNLLLVLAIVLFLLAQASMSGIDYYISQWVNWEEYSSALERLKSNRTEMGANAHNSSDYGTLLPIPPKLQGSIFTRLSRHQYILMYAIAMLFMFVLSLSRSFLFFYICLRATIRLHDRLFRGITRATMYFFNTNPSGRILNRFSRDIGCIDTFLPFAMMDCILFFVEFSAIIVLVAVVNYWLLLPTLVMAIVFYFLRHIYTNTARSIKRVEASTRSPIFSHANASFQGLSTIRAFGVEKILADEFDKHQDLNTSAWYLFLATTRAFAQWLELVCVLYIAVVTLSFLMVENCNYGKELSEYFPSSHFSKHENLPEEETGERGTKDEASLPSKSQEQSLSAEHKEKEGQEDGTVQFKVYLDFLKSVNSVSFVAFTALLMIGFQVACSGTDYFVFIWVDWEETVANTLEARWTTDDHVLFYAGAIIITILLTTNSFAFFEMCLKASLHLHAALYHGVSETSMLFFHQNPSGRVMNRFSKDIGLVDTSLPTVMIDSLYFFLELAGIIVIVALANYWLLIPTAVMGAVFYVLRFIFLRTARNVKRVEAISKCFDRSVAGVSSV